MVTGRLRRRLLRLATYASVSTAAVLVGIKAWAWQATDSVSLLSSLVDSTLDVLGSLITFFAVMVSLKPADKEHRFGHGKAEGLAALAQSLIIAASAIFVLKESAERILAPAVVQNAPRRHNGHGDFRGDDAAAAGDSTLRSPHDRIRRDRSGRHALQDRPGDQPGRRGSHCGSGLARRVAGGPAGGRGGDCVPVVRRLEDRQARAGHPDGPGDSPTGTAKPLPSLRRATPRCWTFTI